MGRKMSLLASSENNMNKKQQVIRRLLFCGIPEMISHPPDFGVGYLERTEGT